MSASNLLINVSPGLQEYNSIRVKYERMGEASMLEFNNNFTTLFGNMDELMRRCPGIANGYIEKAIDSALKELSLRNIYDIDEDTFIKKYYSKVQTWDDHWTPIEDKYMSILGESAELDEYRTLRRESRGRIIGGGFGVSGAVKGMAGAAAANLAIGAAHGAFNLAMKAKTAIGNSFKKSAIYKDPDTKFSLAVGIESAVSSVHRALINAINESGSSKISGFIASESEDKAERLVENIKKGRVPSENVRDVLIEALMLNPYNYDAYDVFYDKFGDQSGILESTALYFNIDIISDKKKELLDKKKSALTFATPEDCLKNIKTLEAYASELSYNKFSETKNEIMALHDKLDNERRTFNGTLYDTLEQAQEAKCKHDEVMSRTVDGVTFSTIEEARTQKVKRDDELARTVNGKVFATQQQADNERSKKKVGFLFTICILFFPPLSLLTFRQGYSTLARVASNSWMVFLVVMFVLAPKPDNTQQASTPRSDVERNVAPKNAVAAQAPESNNESSLNNYDLKQLEQWTPTDIQNKYESSDYDSIVAQNEGYIIVRQDAGTSCPAGLFWIFLKRYKSYASVDSKTCSDVNFNVTLKSNVLTFMSDNIVTAQYEINQ